MMLRRVFRHSFVDRGLFHLKNFLHLPTTMSTPAKIQKMSNEISPPKNETTLSSDSKNPERLIWIDLEMTGLDTLNDRILQLACLVTEGDLTLVAEGPDLVIHQDDSILDNMGPWCVETHGKSGLTESVRNSKITTTEAESIVLNFLQQHTPKGKCPLAGNSVGMDKRFLDQYMPRLAEHLHYRIVDVSTVKELCRRWYPDELKAAPVKKLSHRALDDIKESIEELKYYQSAVFK